MNLKPFKPRKVLKKAYLRTKLSRNQINIFKENLANLLSQTNDHESEEYHKNLISDFLKKTYYNSDYFINTKERSDLVVHNDKKADSSVAVIIETKKPTNKSEMFYYNRKIFRISCCLFQFKII